MDTVHNVQFSTCACTPLSVCGVIISSMENNLEKLNEELSALGLETIRDVDTCPERTRYIAHLNEGNWDDKDWVKKLKSLQEKYVTAFHNYFAKKYPFLIFEIGEDRIYWNYNAESGVYDEVNNTVVRGYILALLIQEGLPDRATEAFAKVCLARYRAIYPKRGVIYDSFDNDDTHFHANNGWVELSTLEFTPHTPSRISRIKSAVSYDASATCPIYDKFLNEDVRLSKDKVRVIDQFSGVCLTNDISNQKMLTLIGRTGSGKSTLLEIWSFILGDKATQKKLTELTSESFRFAGSSLAGRTLCWFDEVDVKKTEMSNSLGTLITGDTLNVERKGINGITKVRNSLKCVLTANNLPNSSEHGIYRRLIYIQFTHSFTEDNEHDKDILAKMKGESSGILNRMLAGLHDIRKMRGFTLIAGHDDLIEEYKTQSDTVSEFLDTYFVVGTEEDFVETDLMLATFKRFSDGSSWVKTITPRRFGKMLSSQPLIKFRTIAPKQVYGRGRGWCGLKVHPEYEITMTGDFIVAKKESTF